MRRWKNTNNAKNCHQTDIDYFKCFKIDNMYTIELQFTINNTQNLDSSGDIIESFLAALRMNGQILGKEWALVYKDNRIISYVFVPEADSLNRKYSNKYVSKYYNKLNALDINISQKMMGKQVFSAETCKCTHIDSYILYTHFLSLESPLRCGNCFGTVPLYKILKTYDDEYYDIKCWETNYQCCDTLQMGCYVGERFGTRELSNFKSKLTQNGLEICEKIKKLTGKNVYYYLYHYVSSPKKYIEQNRKCPSCGNEWLLDKRLFDIFDFKCDKCLLLSNISSSLQKK